MMKRKTVKRGLKTLSAGLLLGVSAYALHEADTFDVSNFNQQEIVVCGDKVSIEDFYSHLSYTRKGWIYKTEDGKRLSVDSLSDFHQKDSLNHLNYLQAKRTNKVDTVYVKYVQQEDGTKEIIYQLGGYDSVNRPSMGICEKGSITVREFVAKDPELQEKEDEYNDEYNQTYAHEDWHYINGVNGLTKVGQSYEVKFVEVCMDEVSANLRQFLKQRKKYLESGKKLKYITSRFNFYRDLVNEGKVTPTDKISAKEQKLIAVGVFDAWMKDKFDLYSYKNYERTKFIFLHTNYNGIQENPELHQKLMTKCFTIDGIDYWKYISGKEQEVKDQIPEEYKVQFNKLLPEWKKGKMTFFDKLEESRNQKGRTAYNIFLAKNKLKNLFR